MKEFYVLQENKPTGPFEEAEIISRWRNGTVRYTDLVWAQGLNEWTPFAKLLSVSSSNPTPPKNEELDSENEKRPIADRPILQNTVTSIGDKSKSPDEQTAASTSPRVNDKHPISGIISVVFSSISLLMLMVSVPMGQASAARGGFSTFVGFLLLSITFAIIGIISGLMGLRHPRKILSSLGLLFGGLFVVILAVILISTGVSSRG
jgi:hypothetical protein